MYQRTRKLQQRAFRLLSTSPQFFKDSAALASPIVEFVEELRPAPVPSTTLASLVNQHPVLERLTQLGVELWRCERHADTLLQVDWEQDVVPVLRLLTTLGLDAGPVLTKSPLLLKEPVERIETRLAYLERKGFSGRSALARLVSGAPSLLMLSVEKLDHRLGLLRQLLDAKPSVLRALLLKAPRLTTFSLHPIRETLFTIREEMAFDKEQSQQLLLACPRILLINRFVLRERYALLHEELGVGREAILEFPGALQARTEARLRPRAEFLRHLGRDQWDRRKPGYVSLRSLVEGSDEDFCDLVAHAPLDTFHRFLKSR